MYSRISLGLAVIATALSASVSLAAPTTTRSADVSTTYKVRVTSFDGTGRYGGEELFACHVGAGIEVLCLYPNASPGPGSDFTWLPVQPGSSNPAYLQYAPPMTDPSPPQRLALWNWEMGNGTTRFATFPPGVAPDAVELYLDPARSLLEVYANGTAGQTEWYMCPFNNGYRNTALAAFEGGEVPSDPECAPVWFSRD